MLQTTPLPVSVYCLESFQKDIKISQRTMDQLAHSEKATSDVLQASE